jgi:hypothetical protein
MRSDSVIANEPCIKSSFDASIVFNRDAVNEVEFCFCDQEPMFVLDVEAVEIMDRLAVPTNVRLYGIHDKDDDFFGCLLVQSAIDGTFQAIPGLVRRREFCVGGSFAGVDVVRVLWSVLWSQFCGQTERVLCKIRFNLKIRRSTRQPLAMRSSSRREYCSCEASQRLSGAISSRISRWPLSCGSGPSALLSPKRKGLAAGDAAVGGMRKEADMVGWLAKKPSDSPTP